MLGKEGWYLQDHQHARIMDQLTYVRDPDVALTLIDDLAT